MAIRDVVTGGFGNGTFAGTIPLVVTRGYAIEPPEIVLPSHYHTLYGASAGNVELQGTPTRSLNLPGATTTPYELRGDA